MLQPWALFRVYASWCAPYPRGWCLLREAVLARMRYSSLTLRGLLRVFPLTIMHILWARAPLAEVLSGWTLLNSTLQFDRRSGPWVLPVTLPLWLNHLSPLRRVDLSTLHSLRSEWVMFLGKPFLNASALMSSSSVCMNVVLCPAVSSDWIESGYTGHTHSLSR